MIRISRLFTLLFLWQCMCATALADEVLWKSGENLFIKITEQGEYSDGRKLPNQHPVSLNPLEIREALNNLYVWNKGYFSASLKGAMDDEDVETVFSQEQARLLGLYIANGLRNARPDQDITFALVRRKKSFLFMKDTVYTAGRAFFIDGKLNIIMGDYDKLGDKFKERAYASSGVSEVKYYFKTGKRAKPSGFNKGIVIKDGIDIYTDGSKKRSDWFVIDIKKSAASYVASTSRDAQQAGAGAVNDEAIKQEAAKLAKERREMRLEMARLRKEMKEAAQNNSLSAEERLLKLKELKDKGLISEEEYNNKRREILNEI